MRLLTLLSPGLFAAAVFATDSDSSSSSSSAVSGTSPASESSSASSASPEEPTPIGAIWTPKWTSTPTALGPFTTHCSSTTTLKAQIYKLGEMYPTLEDFAPQLKVFYNKQYYPGSWNGEDKHGNERELLKMDYETLPYGVREWLSMNKKQRWFSVQEEVVFFAPGAIYPLLPLFVDDVAGKGCENVFDDLDAYSTEPKDGAVLGKVEYKNAGKNEVEIAIEAFQVRARDTGRDEL